ncbi:MAG TPA: PQQ-dependent sugar dehydrogenase, partial [Verrucomicrobiae bacterium]
MITEGLGAPIALAAIPDGSGRLLLAEQSGVIHLLDPNGKRSERLFLDLRPKMVPLNKGMEERGLLCLALHPQFKSNREFYVVYSAPRRTNAPPKWDHTERLSEFKTVGSDFTSADLASERVILEIDEPDWNHNSGRIAFGPDGFLYMSVGDGGAFNDVGDVARGRGHPPEGNGQKLDTLLGKVLRLDVDHGSPYGIPKDNPYADGKKGLPEIYAYGLRNPWGMSFDRGGKHDLVLADVGQDRWEEINVIVNGGNYGWRLREGFDGFDPKSPLRAPTNAVTVGADGKPFVDPVLTYKTLRGRGTESNAFGVTVIGG